MLSPIRAWSIPSVRQRSRPPPGPPAAASAAQWSLSVGSGHWITTAADCRPSHVPQLGLLLQRTTAAVNAIPRPPFWTMAWMTALSQWYHSTTRPFHSIWTSRRHWIMKELMSMLMISMLPLYASDVSDSRHCNGSGFIAYISADYFCFLFIMNDWFLSWLKGKDQRFSADQIFIRKLLNLALLCTETRVRRGFVIWGFSTLRAMVNNWFQFPSFNLRYYCCCVQNCDETKRYVNCTNFATIFLFHLPFLSNFLAFFIFSVHLLLQDARSWLEVC